jgi:hypothetical protein
MIQEGAAGGGQLDPARAPRQQLRPDLQLEIAQLAAERGLCRMQPLLGRKRDAAFLGDGNEIAEVAQFQERCPMPKKYDGDSTKSFSSTPAKPKFSPTAITAQHVRSSER